MASSIRAPYAAAILFFWLIFAPAAQAAELARSGPAKVSLLEVFSSEGCSSCLPAEKWISRLMQEPSLWKDYVPVVFHVDYWDRLGWKDVYAAPAFTRRQAAYADHWRSDGVYTPGLALDGREWRNWWRRAEPPLPDRAKEAGVLAVTDRGEGRYEITYEPAPAAGTAVCAHAALLGFGIESSVTAGENAGAVLRHDFTVLDYAEAPMGAAGPRWESTIGLHSDVPAPRRGIAAWITSGKNPEPVQAAGAYLNGLAD